MTRTEILIVRHVETEWNTKGMYQGHLDSPVTALGQRQAAALAERLRDEPFTHIYSSDLPRCQSTAAAVAAVGARTLIFDARLREKNQGIFQGLTHEQAQERYPEIFQQFQQKRGEFILPGGGENRQQVRDRVMTALIEYVEKHHGQQLLVVTHGGVLSTIMRHLLGLSPDVSRPFDLLNASLNVIWAHDDRWLIRTLGDVSHLRGLGSRDDGTAN